MFSKKSGLVGLLLALSFTQGRAEQPIRTGGRGWTRVNVFSYSHQFVEDVGKFTWIEAQFGALSSLRRIGIGFAAVEVWTQPADRRWGTDVGFGTVTASLILWSSAKEHRRKRYSDSVETRGGGKRWKTRTIDRDYSTEILISPILFVEARGSNWVWNTEIDKSRGFVDLAAKLSWTPLAFQDLSNFDFVDMYATVTFSAGLLYWSGYFSDVGLRSDPQPYVGVEIGFPGSFAK